MLKPNLCTKCHSDFSSAIGSEKLSSISLETIRSQIRSGYGLSTEEISQFQFQLEGIRDDIEQCDALISSVQVLLDKRDKLEQYANHCRGLLSPIRKLPQEILGEIFAHFCADEPSLAVGNSPAGDTQEARYSYDLTGPLLISHVCKLWHDIALSRSSLWSNIDINLFFGAGSEELIYLYLSRSQPTSLTLKITARDKKETIVREEDEIAYHDEEGIDYRDEDEIAYRYGEEIVYAYNDRGELCARDGNLLANHSHNIHKSLIAILCEAHRWKSVSFDLDIYYFDKIAFMVAYEIAVKPFRVDNLRELEIIRELDDETDYFHREINHDHNFLKLFHSVPSLYSLNIARLDPRLPFPFAQLRSVAIDDSLHDLDLSQVFTLCPAMQELSLRSLSHQYIRTSQPISPNTIHYNLCSMSLRLRRIGLVSSLVSSVTLPNLRDLTLRGDPFESALDPNWIECHRNLIHMLQRSACSLESLTLELITLDEGEELSELLMAMPTLNHFRIILNSPYFSTNTLLQILMIRESTKRPNVLQNLTHLRIDISETSNMPNLTMSSSMIKSRARGNNGKLHGMKFLELVFQLSAEGQDTIKVQRFISDLEPYLYEMLALDWRFEICIRETDSSLVGSNYGSDDSDSDSSDTDSFE
ncbi:hypothetical protein VKT23_002516 [Stygiomarasmius scandens]|uniref:F-box domain-containing protein n=1 Tax=Marasmiellus scandens TaxID=2682957 RepID=A0ABR1K286_9AGAR